MIRCDPDTRISLVRCAAVCLNGGDIFKLAKKKNITMSAMHIWLEYTCGILREFQKEVLSSADLLSGVIARVPCVWLEKTELRATASSTRCEFRASSITKAGKTLR